MAQGITMSNNDGVTLYPLTVASQVKVDATKTLDVYLEEREEEIDSTIATTVGNKVEEVLKQNNFATKDDIQAIIPSNATETGAGIVRAATQAEVNDGHVSDNDPSEMAFVRPETLQSKLDTSYPTIAVMTQAISESKEEVMEDIEIGGRNLFIASDVVIGGIDGSTGAENTGSARAKSSGYIPVTGNVLTAKSWDNSLKFMICYYNQSKAFLTSSWKENNNTWIETSVKKYAVPANTAYIRVLLAKNNDAAFTSSELSSIKIKIEQGNKVTDWTPAPEDINTEISNAETRSKAHAEDYTDAEITKIENGETVAQKANSLYDADSNMYKNWGEIDKSITEKIGDQFEDYATKSYVQNEISNQVAVPIASETEYGKVELATPEDVTAVEADGSAVNNAAKAVTPYTLKEYIASKNFATDSDISSAVNAAKPTIFFQAARPAGGKDGDIWIIP